MQIVAAGKDWMTLTGYQMKEREVAAPLVAFQQSWLLRCAQAYDREMAWVEDYNRRRAAGEAD